MWGLVLGYPALLLLAGLWAAVERARAQQDRVVVRTEFALGAGQFAAGADPLAGASSEQADALAAAT